MIDTKTIAQIKAGLERREFSSVEVTTHFLQRIQQHSNLNAFVTVTAEQALQKAAQADAMLAVGDAGPMTGIPIAHKDIFVTEGVKTSCGSKMLDNFVPPYSAAVIENCDQAGMVMLGKTNMDEFAMGSSNETSHYGPVLNPWDLSRVPGGSSGGSAATVAAGLAPVATGTDTGGSIRQPASLCGITGLKPTYGCVSRWGMIAFASSLDQAGPMAKTSEDCAYMLNLMSGFDPKDSTSIKRDKEDYTRNLGSSLEGIRIGLPKEYFGDGLDVGVENSIREALGVFEAQGAILVDISLQNSNLSVPTYYIVAPAECSSNLSRFDGVRFGYRCDAPADLTDLYLRSRGEGFGSEVKRRIMIGTYALSAGYYDAYYLKAQKIRRLISQDFTDAFSTVDVIMGPTAPETAFKFGEKSADPVSMYLSDIYTIATNLAGLPGMSIPAAPVNGMPVGLHMIGNYWQENQLLNLGYCFQQETDWHQQVPENFK